MAAAATDEGKNTAGRQQTSNNKATASKPKVRNKIVGMHSCTNILHSCIQDIIASSK